MQTCNHQPEVIPMEVIALDHIYVTVSDFPKSEAFYDQVMGALGFRKGDKPIGGDRHAHYFNRVLQYTIRPARNTTRGHDPYAVGLHHVCFQVLERESVDKAWRLLRALGIEATQPAEYPEYNDDYYATFFADPDGIRLELVARSRHREAIVTHWHEFRAFLNPLADLQNRAGG
jgi:glyoxylase I family protein